MLNLGNLFNPCCLAILLRAGCRFLIALAFVAAVARMDAAEPTLLDYFHACGIGDDAFATFSDDRQIADEELAVIRSIATRLRDCPADRLQRLAPPEVPAADGQRAAGRLPAPAEAKSQRGRMWELQGSLASVQRVQDPDAEPLWRCEVKLSDHTRRAVVYVAEMPEKLRFGNGGQRVSLDGVFIKYAPGVAAEPMAVLVAPRLRWHDDSPLGNLGMDFGLFEGIRDNSPLTSADREAFYRLLLLTRNFDPDDLKSDAERGGGAPSGLPELFRDPASQRGRLVRLSGTARRVVRVPVGDPPMISRLGADHYFEIDILVEGRPGNPLIFCSLDLPDGMPLSGAASYGEGVDVAGFFLKAWQYPTALSEGEKAANPGSSRAWQIAPLLIGPAPHWKPAGAWRPAKAEKETLMALVLGGCLLLATIGVCLQLWQSRQSKRGFSRRADARK